jgi:hypothetical protein
MYENPVVFTLRLDFPGFATTCNKDENNRESKIMLS